MSYKTYEVKVYDDGTKQWFLDGKLHREDGEPAIEYPSGYKEWFLDDKPHREDGPAVEDVDGYKAWYLNGKRHREDGPAVKYADGSKAWFLDGKMLTEEEFNQRMNPEPSCEGKVVEIDGKKYKLSEV